MYRLRLLLFVTLVLSGVRGDHKRKARSIELGTDALLCASHCQVEYNRRCDQPPYKCGGCLTGFVSRDSLCLRKDADSSPYGKEEAKQPLDSEEDFIDSIAAQRQHSADDIADVPPAQESLFAPGKNERVYDYGGKAPFMEEYPGESMRYPGAQVPMQYDDIAEQESALLKEYEKEFGREIGLKPEMFQKKREDDDVAGVAVGEGMHPKAMPMVQTKEDLGTVHKAANMADIYFLAVVVGCSIAGLVGLVLAGFCWFKLQKNVRDASEVDYPAYGITSKESPPIGSPGDRKLAQSAQMYHYQHQKQQMIAMEKSKDDMKPDGSDEDSEEENEEGDYTVYECPGLAPSGEMEVKNPLFSEETPQTPAPPSVPSSEK